MMNLFLSTPSARRATMRLLVSFFGARNFYPRPPRGGRRGGVLKEAARKLFLSTPSARRATVYGSGIGGLYLLFLSTPSARRATRSTFPAIPTIAYFYPRPPRGGRLLLIKSVKCYIKNFYPRPPRGGRQFTLTPKTIYSKFLSTPSARRATENLYFR